MNKRTERLIELMQAHELDAAAVGKILGRSPRTVLIWRCKDERRTIPDHSLQLLELAVAKPKDTTQAAQ
jgi:hypothetical protein